MLEGDGEVLNGRLECFDGRLAGVREHLVASKGNRQMIKHGGEALKNTLFSQK